MKLLWVLCVCLVGKLHSVTAAEDGAAQGSNLDSSYMMAFPMPDEEQLAEESAVAAVKTLAEAIVGAGDDEAKDSEDQETKEPVFLDVEEKKDNGDDEATVENVEPIGILEAQMATDDDAPKAPRRSLFKRPKIEDLRKILGFPSPDANAAKPKAIPLEKPKAFQGMLKPKPKPELSPNGLQISLPLRREDRTRPFGFPMLPLQRNEGIIRPFGFPDLVQAASSILRRAIIDDMDAQDINDKDDKDGDDDEEANEEEESNNDSTNESDNEEDDGEDSDEPLMIIPIPDGRENSQMRPPLFRRFPLPLPFPVPRPMPANRPRLPMPPIAPVALFLPLAQQIMQNIMTRPAPRAQPPPLLPVTPIHQLIPIQHQIQHQIQHPIQYPIQHPIQHLIPIVPIQHNMVPIHPPLMHIQQPMQHFVPVQTPLIGQSAMHAPIFIPLPPNAPGPFVQPMARRMPMYQPQPQMSRRMPMPNPMARIPMPPQQPQHVQQMAPQFINYLPPRHMAEPAARINRVVRPPMPPVHPVFIMVPTNAPMMPQQQQQIPVFHRPPQIPMMQQHIPVMHRPMPPQIPQEEERIVLIRSDPEEQDDDQEVLILVPTDEAEAAQRPPMLLPQTVFRPPPVATPLQRIQLLRELLMARQNKPQPQMPVMPVQGRSPRIVEIVQQQLRIIPTHHQRGQPSVQLNPSRADASELHPVYVPYPEPQ